jgi:hypothetical protein
LFQKLAKSTFFALIWKNFMDDENVFSDVSYEMLSENLSHFSDFFSTKTWQRFHRPERSTGNLGKSLWNKNCFLNVFY